jgi:protein-L-isoaspartate(D-aspartate) O-methyltransferase
MIGRKVNRFVAAFGLLISLLASSALAQQGGAKDPYALERERLIRNVLIPGGVKDPRVLDSVAKTLRHEFVPPQYVGQAYLDIAIPIGESATQSHRQSFGDRDR